MRKLSDRELREPVANKLQTQLARLRVQQTVGQALAAIRQQPPDSRIIYFYVVDDDDRLVGVIPTRRLLLASLDTPLEQIMVRSVVAIPHTATVLEACEFFVLHRLLAFPVVDAERRILGTVDVELYTHELEELDRSQRNDDLFQLIGVHLSDAQQSSPVLAFRNRFPWLLANIAGGIVAAFLSRLYEAELQQVIALALFIPVVLALAESVSIQSVSLALEALHGHPPTLRSIVGRLRAELFTGALLGAASAVIVAAVALVWLGDGRVAAALLGGIAGSVTCAALIGMTMPNLLRLIHRDPQVAAGPV
ncbi:MAG TPA: CBS domain-containing protein, partial [Lacipirellulaceae bacterium]|nr:CBS domain-containing protein [Lacipirellulaceae bacterium]